MLRSPTQEILDYDLESDRVNSTSGVESSVLPEKAHEPSDCQSAEVLPNEDVV